MIFRKKKRILDVDKYNLFVVLVWRVPVLLLVGFGLLYVTFSDKSLENISLIRFCVLIYIVLVIFYGIYKYRKYIKKKAANIRAVYYKGQDAVNGTNQNNDITYPASKPNKHRIMLYSTIAVTVVLTGIFILACKFNPFNKNAIKNEIQSALNSEYPALQLKVVTVFSMGNEATLESWQHYSVNVINPDSVLVQLSWDNNKKIISTPKVTELYKNVVEANYLSQSLQKALSGICFNLSYYIPKPPPVERVSTGEYNKIYTYFFISLNKENKQEAMNQIKATYLSWIKEKRLEGAYIQAFFINTDEQVVLNSKEYLQRKFNRYNEYEAISRFAEFRVSWNIDGLDYKQYLKNRKPDYIEIVNKKNIIEKFEINRAVRDYARNVIHVKDFDVVSPALYVNQETLDQYFILSGIYSLKYKDNNMIVYGILSVENGNIQWDYQKGIKRNQFNIPDIYNENLMQ